MYLFQYQLLLSTFSFVWENKIVPMQLREAVKFYSTAATAFFERKERERKKEGYKERKFILGLQEILCCLFE